MVPDIRATGRASDNALAVDGAINVIAKEVESSDLPATYKFFIDIYAYGADIA